MRASATSILGQGSWAGPGLQSRFPGTIVARSSSSVPDVTAPPLPAPFTLLALPPPASPGYAPPVTAPARRPIRKLLIANRGEIALRVIRAAHEAGSGPSGETIIAACRHTGADAVHPGYGFLSENPAFRKACDAAGVTFIGPPRPRLARHGRQGERTPHGASGRRPRHARRRCPWPRKAS